eukprot:scaffold7595_cov267-Pinguiococcus_pyrenoidosus.AAC.12
MERAEAPVPHFIPPRFLLLENTLRTRPTRRLRLHGHNRRHRDRLDKPMHYGFQWRIVVIGAEALGAPHVDQAGHDGAGGSPRGRTCGTRRGALILRQRRCRRHGVKVADALQELGVEEPAADRTGNVEQVQPDTALTGVWGDSAVQEVPGRGAKAGLVLPEPGLEQERACAKRLKLRVVRPAGLVVVHL